jgi:hypothetical protein
MVDSIFKFVAFIAAMLGLLTAAAWIDRAGLPQPGLVCWRVERATSAGREHQAHCAPATGWHLENWPGVEHPVSVPNYGRTYYQ